MGGGGAECGAAESAMGLNVIFCWVGCGAGHGVELGAKHGAGQWCLFLHALFFLRWVLP